MKATIENIINGTNLDDFDLKFNWMLFHRNKKDYDEPSYELIFCETTFYPEIKKLFFMDDSHLKYVDTCKKIIKSSIYKEFINALKNNGDEWFKVHDIYTGKGFAFYGASPEAIKNDICFSKILPYLDPTKMEIIELN